MNYERLDEIKAKPKCLIITLIIIILMISIGGIFVYWLAYKHGLSIGIASLLLFKLPKKEPLPFLYNLFDPEINFEFNFEYNYPFNSLSILHILEYLYRKQGITEQYLDYNEYLYLSPFSYYNLYLNFCEENFHLKYCKNNNNSYQIQENLENLNEFINYYPLILKYILPLTICTKFQCNNLNKFLNLNPLNFNIEKILYSFGIIPTKKLLLSSKRPLQFFIKEPIQIYNNLKFNLFQNFNQEIIFDYNSNYSFENYYSMLLIGYNDNFISQEINNYSTKGGFIFKKNWGLNGNSLNYLLGKISKIEEQNICPNDNFYNWIPSNFECIHRGQPPVHLHQALHSSPSRTTRTGTRRVSCASCVDLENCV